MKLLFLVLFSFFSLIDPKACVLRLNKPGDAETDWDQKIVLQELSLTNNEIFLTKDATSSNEKFKSLVEFKPALTTFIQEKILKVGFDEIYVIGHASGKLSIMSGAKGGSIVDFPADDFRDIFAGAISKVKLYMFTCATTMVSKGNVEVVFSTEDLTFVGYPYIKSKGKRMYGFIIADLNAFDLDHLEPIATHYEGDNLGKISDAMILLISDTNKNPITASGAKFVPFGEWTTRLDIDYGDWDVSKKKPANYGFEIVFKENRNLTSLKKKLKLRLNKALQA